MQEWHHLCATLLTSDSVHRCDLTTHHVVHIEHLVLQAGGDHRFSISAERCFVDGETLQVDALDLWVCLPVHLKEEKHTHTLKVFARCVFIQNWPTSKRNPMLQQSSLHTDAKTFVSHYLFWNRFDFLRFYTYFQGCLTILGHCRLMALFSFIKFTDSFSVISDCLGHFQRIWMLTPIYTY